MIKVPDFISERLQGYPQDYGVKLILSHYFDDPDVYTDNQFNWINFHLTDLYRIGIGESYYSNDLYFINIAGAGNTTLDEDYYVNVWPQGLFISDNEAFDQITTAFTLDDISERFPWFLAKKENGDYWFLEPIESEVA